jgi:gliding motility-associated-like protein
LYIPNAFTPNNDPHNQDWGVVSRGIEEYSIVIVTTWGEIVFKSNDPKQRWDGKANGEDVKQTTLVYRIEGRDLDGIEFKRSGAIYIMP